MTPAGLVSLMEFEEESIRIVESDGNPTTGRRAGIDSSPAITSLPRLRVTHSLARSTHCFSSRTRAQNKFLATIVLDCSYVRTPTVWRW